MSASWKCQQCGIVNFLSDPNCKKCGGANQATGQGGVVLEDGYVMPPPPGAGGIWRDGKVMIMHKHAYLPDRCVKCNAPAQGLRLKRKLAWHHPALYILCFGAMLFYLILAMALSKRATVEFGLCREHSERRRRLLWGGVAILAMGLIIPVIAFANDYPGIGLLGILIFLVALVWLIVVNRLVSVKRIDEEYLWLQGINHHYLAQFRAQGRA